MSATPEEPTEQQLAELRAAYEAQMKQVKAADVIVQSAVSLINVAGRRLGISADTRDERDLEQARDAIDAVRGLVPVLERCAGPDLRALRDALGNLQMAYAREAQAAGAPAPGTPTSKPPEQTAPASTTAEQQRSAPSDESATGDAGGDEGTDPRRPGPAEASGRLWVPGR